MSTITDIEQRLASFHKKRDDTNTANLKLEAEVETEKDRKKRKILRHELVTSRTDLNKLEQKTLAEVKASLIEYLFSLEDRKIKDVLPETFHASVKQSYLILADIDRFCGRYLKLPKSWIELGFIAGVLEDLVVVMRTASQLNISTEHLIPLETIINSLRDDQERFPCLTRLFRLPRDQLGLAMDKALASQGKAKRISVYDGHYYAIQGLLGGVKFDSRVVKTLTENNCPLSGVHFTKSEIASNIWTQKETTSHRTRSNGKSILTGAICKFDRPVHALTNIEHKDGYYRIVTTDKDIADRMAHGIKDTEKRAKYESALVIDIKKVIRTLGPDMVQMNELGTLLVHDDIPHDCLLGLISTDKELAHFWQR